MEVLLVVKTIQFVSHRGAFSDQGRAFGLREEKRQRSVSQALRGTENKQIWGLTRACLGEKSQAQSSLDNTRLASLRFENPQLNLFKL